MAYKIISAITFITVLSISFYGCDDTVGPVIDVSGTVYGFYFIPGSNIKVTIGDKSTITSADGSFAFGGVSFPYDVIVSDSLQGFSTIFKNISAGQISLPLDRQLQNFGEAVVRVKIPDQIRHADVIGKLIFTDGNYLNSASDIIPNDSLTNVNLYFNVPVTGKLIVLTFKRDLSGQITSYENYGESPHLEVQPGGNYFYEFDSLSLSLNPGEETVTGSIEIPSGAYSNYSDFYLSFSSKKGYSGSRFSLIQIGIFSFKMPTGLPTQFSTIVTNNTYGGNVGSSSSKFVVYPNASNRLEINNAPALISPENGATNVNGSTQFSFGIGSGDGIYSITLHNQSRFVTYTIVTSNTNFTLEDLENMGFGSIKNNNFRWYVNKMGPAGSMNDYVTGVTDLQSTFVTRSDDRSFSTQP